MTTRNICIKENDTFFATFFYETTNINKFVNYLMTTVDKIFINT